MKSVFDYARQDYEQQLQLKQAREDPALFAIEVLKIHKYIERYMRLKQPNMKITNLADFQQEWLKDLKRITQGDFDKEVYEVIAPRGHWKTTLFAIVFPLWGFLNKENTYIFSNSKTQSRKILERTKHVIEWASWFYDPEQTRYDPAEFPYLTNPSKEVLGFSNGAQYIASSIGSSSRGAHPHNVVCDDLLQDPEKGVDSARLRYVNRYFNGAIAGMAEIGSAIIAVGTPQTFTDVYMKLLENPQCEAHVYQSVLNYDSGDVLFPEVWSFERLMRKRELIGTLAFDREYMCKPLDESSSLFPYTMVSECFDPSMSLIHSYREAGSGLKLKVFCGCDLAISAQTGADYFVIVVLGVDNLGNRYVLDIYREKGLNYKGQVDCIKYYDKRYLPKKFYVEDNSFQRIIRDMVRDTSGVPVQGYTTGRKKADLTEGVPSLRVHFENKKYKIPRNNRKTLDWHGARTSAEVTDVLVRELAAFSYIEGKVEGLGEHDDCVMALFFCEEAIREWEGTKIKVAPVDLFGKKKGE